MCINEEVRDMKVRDEDKQFIAQIYAYIFIGLMLDWIKDDMREDPQHIVDRLAKLIKGSMSAALVPVPDSDFIIFARFD